MGTVVGLGISILFPTGDIWIYDWQMGQRSFQQKANSPITLVTVEEHGPASCGPGRWNTAILAQSISALNQAQAKVIAPALRLDIPTSPECGDLAGLAKLIEATRQAGNVVYPFSVPDALASEASRIGVLELETDEDGVFRRIPLKGVERGFYQPPFWDGHGSPVHNRNRVRGV